MSKLVLVCHISRKMKLDEAVKGTVLGKWNLKMGLLSPENQRRFGRVTHTRPTQCVADYLKYSFLALSATGRQKGAKEGSPEHTAAEGTTAEPEGQSSSPSLHRKT